MPILEAHAAIQALDMGGTGHKVRGFLAVDVSPITPQRNSQHPFLYNAVGRETPNTARDRLRNLIQDGQRDINRRGYRLVGIGADMPDPSDYKQGIFQAAHKKDLSPLVGVRLDGILAPEHGDEPMDDIPIFYLNDGDAGAKGVMHKYKDRRILVVTFGKGLGGGFVVDGKMAAEGQGAPKGGEIWNLDIHDPSGEYVHTEDESKRLETKVSRGGIIAAYQEKTGREEPELDLIAIENRAKGDDTAAIQAYAEFGEAFGEGLVFIAERFHPTRIVITGGPAKGADLFMPQAREVFDHYRSPYVDEVPLTVNTATNFNLLGGALYAREQLAKTA